MSKTIDEKVVSFSFDNKNFEKNANTSLSTLDKLKEKLGFKGATKGLEDIQKASSKTDLSGMQKGIDAVEVKFSALQIVAQNVLGRITNAAITAGTNLVNSFTVEPITAGFNEYELKMGSIQTIMAGTGESLATVNQYLDELNTYSDKTIYSFADMTQNIGKFTNAGVSLKDSVEAIQGISNVAAVSGANAEQASRAMFNFSQALSAGYVKLIDWTSIENAGMATMEFKEQLIETAVATGQLTKEADGTYKTLNGVTVTSKMFRDTLQEQWLTTEVLTGTLSKYSDETTEIGKKAMDAAQDVKTFSMMMSTLKETAQSGWAKTFEIIFGDFEKAKDLFTSLTNFFSNVITGIQDPFNNFLQGALGTPVSEFTNKISKMSETVTETLEPTTKIVEDFGKTVDAVMNGDFGNGETRVKKLADAGFEYAKIQNLVNEKLGDSTRYTEALTEAAKDQVRQTTVLTDAKLKEIGLTEDEIEMYRALEIQAQKTGKSINELATEQAYTGASVDELGLEDFEVPTDGRTLLLESLANIGGSVVKIFQAIGAAWRDIFPPLTSEMLYKAIEAFHGFSQSLILSDENADKVRRTFGGLFAILDLITTIVWGGIRTVWWVFTEVLKALDLNVLDVTASIGDWLQSMVKLFKALNPVAWVIEFLVPVIVRAVTWIINLVRENEYLMNIFNRVGDAIMGAIDGLRGWIQGIKDADNVGRYIIEGLLNGLLGGFKLVTGVIGDVAQGIITTFCRILGINSPSTVMDQAGQDTMQGYANGVTTFFKTIYDLFIEFGQSLIRIISEIDLATAFAGLISISVILGAVKFLTILDKVVSPLEGVGEVLTNFAIVVRNVGKSLKAYVNAKKWEVYSKALRNVAISIGILAVSVWILSKIEAGPLWMAVSVLGVLALVITLVIWQLSTIPDGKVVKIGGTLLAVGVMFWLLSKVVENLSELEWQQALVGAGGALVIGIIIVAIIKKLSKIQGDKILKIGGALIAVGVMFYLMGLTMKMLGKMSWESLGVGIVGIGALTAIILFLIKSLSKISPSSMIDITVLLLSVTASLGILALVVKMLGSMDGSSLGTGLFAITYITAIILLLVHGLKSVSPANMNNVTNILLATGATIFLLAFTINMLGKMDPSKLLIGLAAVTYLLALVMGMIAILSIMPQAKIQAMTGVLIGIAAVVYLLGLTVKMLGKLSPGQAATGIVAITILLSLVTGMILILGKFGSDLPKVAATLLGISIAIMIMGYTIKMLGTMSIGDAVKGIAIATALGALIVILTNSLKNSDDAVRNLIAASIAIAILGATLLVISLIPTNKALIATGILASIMVGLTGILYSAKGVNAKDVAPLLLMAVVVAVLAIIVNLLSKNSAENALSSAIGLSVLMVVMVGIMKSLKRTGFDVRNVSQMIISLVMLSLLVVIMKQYVNILAMMSGVENAAKNAIALSVLMVAMGILLGIVALAGLSGPAAYSGLLVLGVIIVLIYAVIGAIAIIGAMKQAERNIGLLLVIMNALGDLMVRIAAVGPGAFLATPALIALAALIPIMATVALALGALIQIPGLEEFINGGLALMIKVASGIGEMIGAFVGSIVSSLMSALPALATNLSLFMMKLTPFIIQASRIDQKVIDGAKGIVGIILALTAAQFLDGIAKLIGISTPLPELAEKLVLFAVAMAAFGVATEGLDAAHIKVAAEAGKALADLATALPKDGGWMQTIFGSTTDMETFGEKLEAFGGSLVKFAKAVGAKGVNFDAVKQAAEVTQPFVDMTEKLKPIGGLWQDIFGSSDLGTFGNQLYSYGESLVKFAGKVSEITSPDVIWTAVDMTKALVEVAGNIEKDSGIFAFFGSDDIDNFGKDLEKFAGYFVSFYNKFRYDTEFDAGFFNPVIDTLGKTVSTLGGISDFNFNGKKIGSNIEEFGGLYSSFYNKINYINPAHASSLSQAISDSLNALIWINADTLGLYRLGLELEGFGATFSSFYNKVSYIDPANLSALTAGIKTALGSLIQMGIDATSGVDITAILGAFANFNLEDFASSISSGIPLVTNAVSVLIQSFSQALMNGSQNLEGVFSDMIWNVANSILAQGTTFSIYGSVLGNFLILGFRKSINILPTDLTAMFVKTTTMFNLQIKLFRIYGQNLMTSFNLGVTLGTLTINRTITNMVTGMQTTINSFWTKFFQSGNYLVTGFESGIIKNTYKATNAAEALGIKSLEALEKAIEQGSPSKATTRSGGFFGEGYALGIWGMVSESVAAAKELGSASVLALNNSLQSVSMILADGIDDTPVIRPVIDLTEVRKGVSYINSAFSSATAREVSSHMSGGSEVISENQNGKTSEPGTINFIQNNTSPKALSAAEIFRDTKSLFSMAKEKVGVK